MWAAYRSFKPVGGPQRQAGAVVVAEVGKLVMMAVMLLVSLTVIEPRVVEATVAAFIAAYVANVVVVCAVSLTGDADH